MADDQIRNSKCLAVGHGESLQEYMVCIGESLDFAAIAVIPDAPEPRWNSYTSAILVLFCQYHTLVELSGSYSGGYRPRPFRPKG